MDLKEAFVIFVVLLKSTLGTQVLKCYQCRSQFDADYNKLVDKVCEGFQNHTNKEEFLVDCNYSTICYKRTTTLEVNNEIMTIVNRGCAPQTMDGDQVLKDKKWRPVKRVFEVYEIGCTHRADAGRPTDTEECFCRGDYCNGSLGLKPSFTWVILFTVFLSLFYA